MAEEGEQQQLESLSSVPPVDDPNTRPLRIGDLVRVSEL